MYVGGLLDLLGDQDPVSVLSGTPEALQRFLEGVPAHVVATAEAPGKWSIRDVVQHLADSELVGGFRLRMVLAHDRPKLTGYDQDSMGEPSAIRHGGCRRRAGSVFDAPPGECDHLGTPDAGGAAEGRAPRRARRGEPRPHAAVVRRPRHPSPASARADPAVAHKYVAAGFSRPADVRLNADATADKNTRTQRVFSAPCQNAVVRPTRSARGKPGRDVGVAVGVDVVARVEQVLHVRLQTQLRRERDERGRVGPRVARAA